MRRALVPWAYPVRSLIVRWPAAVFSAVGIAMTVAVLAGVFALRDGLSGLLGETGSDEVIVYLRKGAKAEGESGIPYDRVAMYKVRPEVAKDEQGRPLAAGETYLALFLPRIDGGQTNIPIRGIEEASIRIQGDSIRLVEGRWPTFGTDEVVVGAPVARRVKDCRVRDTLTINVTPFKVVGLFQQDGAYSSEIWGDVDRISRALERPYRQRVVARLAPGWTAKRVQESIDEDKQLPSKAESERTYFASQKRLQNVLDFLGKFLSAILGVAAILGAANTMLAAVGARTREIGVLRALGFGGPAILLAFLVEASLIGLAGGILGALLVLPLQGLETGTMNWNTFTEATFAFRVGPALLLTAVVMAVGLGLLGGLIPAWRASRLRPVAALRRL